MTTLHKAIHPGAHHHVQYYILELHKQVPFLQECIDSTSDSKVGKATQAICNKLFTQGKTKRVEKNEFHHSTIELYEVSGKEILFFKIISKIVADKGLSRCKLLEELAKLSKTKLEEQLILMKVTG